MDSHSNQFFNHIHKSWHGKPYYSLDAYCKNTYGEKLYKISLNAGMTCPNRDGTLGEKGCIFCSAGGSGDFAAAIGRPEDVFGTLPAYDTARRFDAACQEGLSSLSGKKTGQRFIIYFQAYTNTYGSIAYLEMIYRLALDLPLSAGISIATRPDCLAIPVLELLMQLKREYASKFIWIELGLQTIHEDTAAFIRRGYPLSCFKESVERLKEAGIPVIVHVILGLPGEGREDMLSTIHYLNEQPVWGIKLQLLHILAGTDLGLLWEKAPESCGSFPTLELYLDVLTKALEHLRPDMVIHRLTGDAPKASLLFPLWSSNKRLVLNTLHRQMKEQGSYQGRYFEKKDG
ncbi:MAG: TIGR01212 family radical SAM protein [Lachnospiraceae bacterium]|nr:TIGR01212 family radical SAM protein [Lachnospiraceae bacterium]